MRLSILSLALLFVGCTAASVAPPYPHQWHGKTPSYVGRTGLDAQAIPEDAVAQLELNEDGMDGWQMKPRHLTGPDMIVLRQTSSTCLAYVERRARIASDQAYILAAQLRDEVVGAEVAATPVYDDVPAKGQSSFACHDFDKGMGCYGTATLQPGIVDYGLSVLVMCPLMADRSEYLADLLIQHAYLVYRQN